MDKFKKIIAGVIDVKKIKGKFSSSKNAHPAPPFEDINTKALQPAYARIVQNFLLVWLDSTIDEVHNNDSRNTITKLRQVINSVNTFTDVNKCAKFIEDIKEEKVFMISSGSLGQTAVSIVHDMPQAEQWSKVKGVFTDITFICEELKQAAQECDQNSLSMSFVATSAGASNQNLDQLNQSFMYTQILKEILLTIEFDDKHFNEFLIYCREQLLGNTRELKNLDKLGKEYHRHPAIWWYTYDCFLYSMLNRALRTMEVDIIIQMGFFVSHLHQHLVQLHSEQFTGQNHSDSFTVFRGQGLSPTDFDQLMKTKGGLLSFNNFLSTSKDREVSLRFAHRMVVNSNLTGILFVMTINPSIPSTPFANVHDVSCYQTEEEILFTMHSVFRIGDIKQIDGNNQLWQVNLKLTSDNDPDLYALTERMREETFPCQKGWNRLGMLLLKLGESNKAQKVCELLLDQVSDERDNEFIYHMLGMVNYAQRKYTNAITFYEMSIEIRQKTLSPHHPDLAQSYNNIGLVYNDMGSYSKALWYHEKALEIRQQALPSDHPDLTNSYNNIGLVYDSIGRYSKALSYHKKALEIRENTLPLNHPDLAASYNNIGGVHLEEGDYSSALSNYEHAVDIGKRSLPENHPNLQIFKKNLERVKKKL